LVRVNFEADYPPNFLGGYDYTFIGSGFKTGIVECCISRESAIDALLEAKKFHAASWFKSLNPFYPGQTIALGRGESEFIAFL